ncbi:MAG: hypothetical protein ACRC68_14590, partial [Clostridium sp.]
GYLAEINNGNMCIDCGRKSVQESSYATAKCITCKWDSGQTWQSYMYTHKDNVVCEKCGGSKFTTELSN